MNFKTDENMPVAACDLLRSFGHDAVSVLDQDLGGHCDQNIAHVWIVEQDRIRSRGGGSE